jgi:hypothetical protein
LSNVEFTQDDKDDLKKLYADVFIGKDVDNLSIVARLHNLESRAKSQDKTFWAVVLLILTEIVKTALKH